MANLKDIVATLAILGAGTLTLTGCKKDGAETTTPDAAASEGDAATEPAAEGDAPAEGEGEASCSGGEGEASCSGGEAGEGEGEASCSGAA